MACTIARRACAVVACAGAAVAAPSALAAVKYSVNPAVADPMWGGATGGHELWMPDTGATSIPNGSSSTFLFVGDSGCLKISDDLTTARLTGTIASVSNPGSVWEVDIRFISGLSAPVFTNPMGHTNPLGGTSHGQPKKELGGHAYTTGGGPVDVGAWRYFYMDSDNSTLTGAGGAIDGVVLDLTQRPDGADYGRHVLQVGVGANGKNIHLGASTWFNYSGQFNGHGDVNLDLKLVPTPGAGALGAMASLAALSGRRRRV
jgi:hypothetical protein